MKEKGFIDEKEYQRILNIVPIFCIDFFGTQLIHPGLINVHRFSE